ncbi:MAG: hypothetical protein AAGI38_19970 [Bacteroidota bacterium]
MQPFNPILKMRRIRDHVVAAKVYLYNPPVTLENESILPEVAYSQTGWVLSPEQVDSAIQILTQKLPDYPTDITWCFIPRHLIVFFDKDGGVLGFVKICFQCSNYMVFPNAPVEGNNIKYFRSIMDELEIPIFSDDEAYVAFLADKNQEKLLA